MARRPNPRAIRAARAYSILECAKALGVTPGTVRGWIRQGLRALKSRRPFLIPGDALRAFLEARRSKGRVRLAPDELYCLTCKAPRPPLGMMADFTPQNTRTARLTSLCSACGGPCNRIVSRASLTALTRIFDVACREGPTA